MHIYGNIAIEVAICPCCQGLTTTIKESKARCVRDCDIWGKRTFLHFETRRFECEECGHRFTEELQAIAWRRRQTKRFEKQIYQACLEMSKNKVAQQFHLSDSTVRGIFKRRAKQARQGKQCGLVKILGIDEISIKKRHKQFAVVISDLERHCVIAVLSDRKKETLNQWAATLSDEQRAAIKTISIDMWGPYRHFCKQAFPKARRVADRFHVMQQLNKQLGKARLAYQRAADAETQAALKGCRWLLVDAAPELKTMYLLKEEFRFIFERIHDKQQAQRFLQAWICKVQFAGHKHLLAFVNTLRNWWSEILNYFDNRVTSGFVEGINRAIRGLIWRAYGFCNFENFRLQILAQHGFS